MAAPIKIKRSDLLDLIWSKPVSVLAAEFGLSPNGLAKICDRLDIPRPPKGYWQGRDKGGAITKPGAIADPDGVVVIGGESGRDRRQRSRMSAADRRKLMLACARDIANTDGLHEVSLKTIAKRLGMSEAQAHNIFSTRKDLLVDLAFEEVLAFEKSRQAAVTRGGSRMAKVVLSSMNYLREVSKRGPLLQRLQRDSHVRLRVDEMRRNLRAEASQRHVQAVVRDKNVEEEDAFAAVSIVSAIVVRAGSLVSDGHLPISEAEKLCIPITIASTMAGYSDAD